ncbi:MAG: signal peptide peptidase SppA [Opitutae bacterium]|nr:signal peptide peptidase SppA [Opitutae bacterium]
MRNFLSAMFGSLAALVIFGVVLAACGLMAVGVIVALGQKHAVPVESGSYLVFDLETNITDAPAAMELGEVMGRRPESLQLRTVTRALRAAAHDEKVAGVLLVGSLNPAGFGTGYAALKEVRAALQEIRTAGKPVHAYLTSVSTRDYYLASMASDVAIDPYGMIMMPGLASQPVFYSGAFEKFGIGVQVTRMGKYKSAIEPFTRRDLSPENREQLTKLLGDLWSDLLGEMAASRNLKPVALQAVIDAEGFIRPEAAKSAKLVDRIIYRDQIVDELKAKTGRKDSKEPFKQIALNDYAKVARDPGLLPEKTGEATVEKAKDGHIAVVYAEGEIVDGEGEYGYIGGTKFARELRRLRQDDDVKAIVLRVNSPGGSASASEAIQREIRLARAKKPVVVSMGAYAASGGYWIAAYGDRIFAEPSTITGSIGVFGLFFDIQKLANGLGFTFDSVKTGKFADTLTIARPKTEQELAVFQRLVDWVYEEFLGKVAEARKLDRKVVEEIGQGRVWSGAAAVKLGLVDELGGLDSAIRWAARKAALGTHPTVTEYPQKKEWLESITEMLDRVHPVGAKERSLVDQIAKRVEAELRSLRAFNDPHGVYVRLPVEIFVP